MKNKKISIYAVTKISAAFGMFVIGIMSVDFLNFAGIISALQWLSMVLSIILLITHDVWANKIMDYHFGKRRGESAGAGI